MPENRLFQSFIEIIIQLMTLFQTRIEKKKPYKNESIVGLSIKFSRLIDLLLPINGR